MKRLPRLDRLSVLVLALGTGVIVVVVLALHLTAERERDHTRGVLVVQRIGRELANTGIALREAAAGPPVVADAGEIERDLDTARGIAREAIGEPSDGIGFGRIEDDSVRRRLAILDGALDAFAIDVHAALLPTGTPAERRAAGARADELRTQNAAIGAVVEDRADADRAWLLALEIALVAILGAVFGALAWQITRNRQALAVRNRALEEAVAERTARLSASETRLRAVITSALDAVIVLDGDGRVLEWNPRAEELLGVPRDQVVGSEPPADAFPPHVAERHDDAMRRYCYTGDVADFNVRVEDVAVRPDGRRIPIEVTMAAAADGERLTISHFVRDITERERARAAIEAARDDAERAAQAKSAFLATMSHEIRTPMNAIVGMTSLLIDTELTREQRDYVETVRLSGDALLAVINDILDFSKIESGRLELEQHPFELRDVIESALDLLAPQATAKGIDLGYLLESDGSARLIGDSTRLRQVVINFLSNAVKFTDEGAVTVHARLIEAGFGRAQLRLEVRDTGIGIPADRLDRLFRSFSQVDASTTRKFGGTGLGLAIARRLVEAMGGEVDVQSTVGEGSAFALELELPRVPGHDPVTDDVPEALHGRRALVVDDNAVNRTLLERQLAAWEVETECFELPGAAIERVASGDGPAFDVAVLDMQMPEMDGLALADRLAEATAFALPMVLLSSIGGVDPALARGRLAATLSKPVKPAVLRGALVDAIAGRAEPVTSEFEQVAAVPVPERPLRVLVAEDNAVNQRVAVATLERLGHRADVAADGLEAVEALHRQEYDLVLMDMQMPNLDGLGATRRIRRELPPERQPRIVAMTANAFVEDRDAAEDAGMDDFLTKPVERDELLRALSDAGSDGDGEPAGGTDEFWAVGDGSADGDDEWSAPVLDDAPDDGLDPMLARIWKDVRGSVLDQVATVEDAVDALLAAPADADARERGRREAHKLAGSVPTFGFAGAGAAARQIELALTGDAFDPGALPRLAQLAAAIRRDLCAD